MLPEEVNRDLEELRQIAGDVAADGGFSVNDSTFVQAEQFLIEAFAASDKLPSPFIGFGFDGRLVIEWFIKSGRELVVDIDGGMAIAFLLVEIDAEGREVETEAELLGDWTVAEVIRRLVYPEVREEDYEI